MRDKDRQHDRTSSDSCKPAELFAQGASQAEVAYILGVSRHAADQWHAH